MIPMYNLGRKSLAKLSIVIMIIFISGFTLFHVISSRAEFTEPKMIVEDPVIVGGSWSKKVTVYHNDSQHYQNIPVSTSIPENLVDLEIYRYVDKDAMVKVTNNPSYAFQVVDTNGNGKYDTARWIVPELSEARFSVEGKLTGQIATTTIETTTTSTSVGSPTTTLPEKETVKAQVVHKVNDEVRDNENNIVGKKIEDELNYETFFTLVGKENSNFVIRFYHNATRSLPVWLEGDVDFYLSANTANPLEEVNLTVPLIDGKIPRFRLHVGYDSDVFEFGITIINVQSYPALYGNWTVRFNTIGTADLSIKAVDGTEFGRDIEFLELRCGDRILTTELTDGVVLVKDYTCDETGYEISKVLTSGKHTLEFRFGDDVEYAYNQAGWLSGWTYRKSHLIINATGADANYTVNITVINGTETDSGSTVYINNKTRSDFGDIRFTNSTNDLLDYWIENVTSGKNATFWVEIPGNLTYTNQTIYIYYGKSDANTQSNAISTDIAQLKEYDVYSSYNAYFEFFVNGSTLRIASTSAAQSGNGYALFVVNPAWLNGTYLRFNVSGNFGATTDRVVNGVYIYDGRYDRWNTTDFPGNQGFPTKGYGLLQNVWEKNFHGSYGPEVNDVLIYNASGGIMGEVTIFFICSDAWQAAYNERFDIHWIEVNTGSGGSGNLARMEFDDNVTMEVTGTYNDYGLTRKYVIPEPTHGAWGSEETPSPSFSNNATNSTIAGTAVNFTIDVTDDSPLGSTTGYIFSTNNSGTWKNASYVAFTGSSTTQTAWNVTILNNTAGALVQWKFYANDTSNNWNVSATYNLTVLNYGYLEVNLTNPDPGVYTESDPLVVGQNRTFTLNSTIKCQNQTGDCGSINGTVRYKEVLTVPWWNTSWPYRKQINIIEMNGTNVYNWTTNFTINTTQLVLDGKMLANMSDVRILDNQTELDYHIEPYTNNTANTVIHFKINLTANENKTTIYMYYGNFSFAAPTYNYSNVYWWWDDFNRANTANISTDPNYTQTGDGKWNITNNILVHQGNSTTDPNKLMIVNLSSDPLYKDVAVVVKARNSTLGGGLWNRTRFGPSTRMDGSGGAGRGYSAILYASYPGTASDRCIGILNDWVGWPAFECGNKWALSQWYYIKFMIINQSAWMKVWNASRPEPMTWNFTNISMGESSLRSTGYIGLTGSDNDTDVIEYDDLRVFRSMVNEPNYTEGSEETNPNMTDVSDTIGDIPFHTVEENPQSCGSLKQGQTCQLNWTINATGAWHTKWYVDVKFNSSYTPNVVANDTNDSTINIVDPVPPKWYDFGTNNTSPNVGNGVKFYARWEDESDLAAGQFKFSWNTSGPNCNVWANDTQESYLNPGNWSNTSKTIETKCSNRKIGFKFYGKDNNGNWNSTSISTIQVNAITDTEKPKWSNFNSNESMPQAGNGVKFYANWSDNVSLDMYMFSWNATGTDCNLGWVNDSATPFTDTWSNISKTLNKTCGNKVIGFKFYANDTASPTNWNGTNVGNISVNYSYGNLEVNLTNPDPGTYTESNPKEVRQNNTFVVNATVKCGGEAGEICGNASGTARYGKPWTFVNVSGTNFTLNGEPFYFAGANAYYLWYRPNTIVDEALEDIVAMNLTVVRTWGFCDGTQCDQDTGGYAFQSSAGSYKASTFQKFDYILNKSKSLGIRLIIPLVNNWNDFGGMNQYVTWCGLPHHDYFYNSSCAKDNYTNYVNYFLNWQNSITGVKYKDDPTILAWELANEPRAQTNTSGELARAWIEEMSNYIRSIDSKHLITTGEEGWWGNENEGVNFTKNCLVGNISYCSFHYLGDQWNGGWSYDQMISWVENHINMSHNSTIGKPVVLGEVAKNATNRDTFYSDWYDKIETLNGNGDTFWMLMWDQQAGDQYSVYYPENASTVNIITAHANNTRAKAKIDPRAINTTIGETPFYTTDNNPQYCNFLQYGNQCQLNWTVNATGVINYNWTIDVLFNSNESSVIRNDTNDAYVKISIKNATLTRLYLDGNESNRVYNQSNVANFTVTLNVSGKTVKLNSNMTGWVIQSGVTPLYNYTNLNEGGYFSVTGYFEEDEDYFESSQTYYVTVLSLLDIHREQPNATGLSQNSTVRLIVKNRGSTNAIAVNLTDYNATGWMIYPETCNPSCTVYSSYVKFELGNISADNFTQAYYIMKAPSTAGQGNFKANATYNFDSQSGTTQDEEFTVEAATGRAYFDLELDLDSSTPTIERELNSSTNYTARLNVTNIGDTEPPDTVWIELKINYTAFNVSCTSCDEFTNDGNYWFLRWNETSWLVGETKSYLFNLNSSVSGYYNFTANSTYDPPGRGPVSSGMEIFIKTGSPQVLQSKGLIDSVLGLNVKGLNITSLFTLSTTVSVIGIFSVVAVIVFLMVRKVGKSRMKKIGTEKEVELN
jgi:mannan endo-1,4-beta-mannosidase